MIDCAVATENNTLDQKYPLQASSSFSIAVIIFLNINGLANIRQSFINLRNAPKANVEPNALMRHFNMFTFLGLVLFLFPIKSVSLATDLFTPPGLYSFLNFWRTFVNK